MASNCATLPIIFWDGARIGSAARIERENVPPSETLD